jgi:hypothetical protein
MITFPGHVLPGVATVTLWTLRGLDQAGQPESRSRSGPRPGSGPKGRQGGAGAEQPQAAEGLKKSAQEPLR